MPSTEFPTPTKCTVVIDGGRCGEPVVFTFCSRSGEVFGECASHSTAEVQPVAADPFSVGANVKFHHRSWPMVGVIVERFPSRARVEFRLASGEARSRVLRLDDLSPAR